MKKFMESKTALVILGVLTVISLGTMVYFIYNRPEEVEIVEVPATTEDRYTGERDGKWFIDGQEVNEEMYNAYLDMMAEENGEKTTEATTEETTEKTTEVALSDNGKSTEEAAKPRATKKNTKKNANGNTNENTQKNVNTNTNGNKAQTEARPTENKPSSSQTTTTTANTTSTASACKHDWVELTTTVHHEAVYQTVVTPAVYANYHCRNCDVYCYDIGVHQNQTNCGDNWSGVVYGTHLLTPEKREEKLVKDAYDETVGTGVYQCTKCGEKK